MLLVDNDPDHADAMTEALERVGYTCTVAESGPEGARRLDAEIFDIIVTDLVMDSIDGMEVLRRAKEALPDAEVIMVTGHATVPKAVETMQPVEENQIGGTSEATLDSISQVGEEPIGQ